MADNNMMMAWHYTKGVHYPKIVSSGVLKCTSSGIPDDEKPVLWFSINPKWENTVSTAQVINNVKRTHTMSETRDQFEGLYRFGVPSNLLIPWIELIKVANIHPLMRKLLEKSARNCGANPYQWMGLLQSMAINEAVIEIMDDDGKWHSVE